MGSAETESSTVAPWAMASIRRDSGLTLIEVLVACAILILAISIICALVVDGEHVVRRTGRRLASTNLARAQLERIRLTPYSSLPPESVTVPDLPPGTQDEYPCAVNLSNARIVASSIEVRDQDALVPNSEYQFHEAQSALCMSASYAGRRLTVNYRFLAPERCEDTVVPTTRPFRVRLFDRAESSTVIATDGSVEIPPSLYTLSGRYLVFDRAYAGRTVTLSYISSGFRSVVSGRYADLDPPSGVPGDNGVKEITLEQVWRDDRPASPLRVTCLRTR